MDKKPSWLKSEYNQEIIDEMNMLLEGLGLSTVCNEAACPNRGECFRKHTATFMILGVNCTRGCRFCNVTKNSTTPVDILEPENIAEAVNRLGLHHVVITSVTRDDLPDGGAAHFANVTESIRKRNKDVIIELLISDLQGDENALKTVLASKPQVLAHNLETVADLYSTVRPQANYLRSLKVLSDAKKFSPNIITKTGIMLGLSETKEQVLKLMHDAVKTGCDIMTIGQYLRPSKEHLPVAEYIHPDIFKEYAQLGKEIGIKHVYSAPFVRSSYNASDAYSEIGKQRKSHAIY